MQPLRAYRALLACDIASSAGRGETALQQIRGTLGAAVRESFRSAGLDWNRCRFADSGDGFQLVAPQGVPKAVLLHPLLADLAAALRAHNRDASEVSRIRVRVALHAGEVQLDAHGGASGAPFEVLARLLNAAPLRDALREAPSGAPVAALLSRHYHEETVGHGYDGIDTDAFAAVEVQEKEYSARAWLCYPGSPVGPRPQSPQPLPPSQSAAMPQAAGQSPQDTDIGAGNVQKNRAKDRGRIYAVQSGTIHVHDERSA